GGPDLAGQRRPPAVRARAARPRPGGVHHRQPVEKALRRPRPADRLPAARRGAAGRLQRDGRRRPGRRDEALLCRNALRLRGRRRHDEPRLLHPVHRGGGHRRSAQLGGALPSVRRAAAGSGGRRRQLHPRLNRSIKYKSLPSAHTNAEGRLFAMEHQKSDKLHMLEAVVQNTEMGKNTLAQILPMTWYARLKAELIRQRSGHHELNQEAHAGMDSCGGRAQGYSAFAMMNTRMRISLKTLTDKSKRNLAEMLSEGSSQWVMDCIKCQKDYPN